MDKVDKYNYKDMYEMKVIEFETDDKHLIKTVEVRKTGNERYLTDIHATREYNKNDRETVYIDFKLGTVAYGSLNEKQWNEYINNLSESKKAFDYFKSIINETTGYKVVEE
ncbi:hypothetical protein P3U41_05655 [Mammaliicoccus sciuri]|uniref:hypothetical protein n=1 Tax=Mammaliicoccus sciuri TaxID=1296 RepID=UPI002B264132|nr:hypothetical protein [Mammaliicoccus sciuri]WQL34254.1 hypothetical protein P3U41_05655 [Mammaliicoccus sciuri]WQL61193.1 hypothetical protein P3T96_05655 [Mammaliicoccus sciuri]